MGIHADDLEFLDFHLEDWKGRRIAVLGSQWIRDTGEAWSAFAARQSLESVIFDWNGEDGAVVIDLCGTIPEEHMHAFDLVLNFGTSEHCINQEDAFFGIHDLGGADCAFLHCVPQAGSWPGHCPFRYKREFFPALAKAGHYSLVTLEASGASPRRRNWRALLVRQGHPPFDTTTFPREFITKERHYLRDRNNLPPEVFRCEAT